MNFRTDLALEAAADAALREGQDLRRSCRRRGRLTVHRLEVLSDRAAQRLEKPRGNTSPCSCPPCPTTSGS